MDINFEPMAERHRREVIDIYNHYILTSFAAYPEHPVSYDSFDRFVEMSAGYPAYAIRVEGTIRGFCFLRAYKPQSSFRHSAEITYFLHQDFTGKGIGEFALQKLEEDAKGMGIRVLLASIASENQGSIRFHLKQGFVRCGNFQGIIRKFDKQYDIIWMQKFIG